MKERKKSMVVFGALLLALAAVLQACSQGNTQKGDNSKSAAAPRGDISTTIYDRGSVPAKEGTIEDNRWTKWVNQNGPANVTFTAIPRTESVEKLNVLFASGSAPDLILEYDANLKEKLYQQKQLLPLDDLIDKYAPNYKKLLQQNPALRKAGTEPDGKLYIMGKLNTITPNRALLIRKDWLKKLNLSVPKTTEDLFKAAQAFADMDPDGNGKKDTYGMALSSTSDEIINYMFRNVKWVVKNGELVFGWENLAEATAFRKRLFDAGTVDKDFLTDKNGAKAKQDFANGKLGIYAPNVSVPYTFVINEYAALKKNVPDAELLVIPLPESPMGQFNLFLGNPVQMTGVVNKSAKNPEAVIRYADFMVDPKTTRTMLYGIEGEHWKTGSSGCPEPIDPEKFNREVSWTRDFLMLQSNAIEGKCSQFEAAFNPEILIQKEGLDLYNQMLTTYLNPNVPYPEITHPEHLPQLPSDLALISSNVNKSITDITSKAVLSGKAYTVEQAMNDAKASWEKAGGAQLDAWYKKWYAENKDKAFLAKDLYDIMKQQQSAK